MALATLSTPRLCRSRMLPSHRKACELLPTPELPTTWPRLLMARASLRPPRVPRLSAGLIRLVGSVRKALGPRDVPEEPTTWPASLIAKAALSYPSSREPRPSVSGLIGLLGAVRKATPPAP